MRAIQLTEFGGADAMEFVEVPDPVAGDGEVVLEIARSGVNFADTHAVENDYLAEQSLPLIPGAEVVGRVDGRRVAALIGSGGYAERVVVPEPFLIDLPDGVSDEQGAAVILQGVTAHALVHRCARLEPGETVVVQAAAGGTGSLAVQVAKRAGAKVIAMASTEEKRGLATRLGADATVDSGADDLRDAILEANGGRPVNAVFEMTGGETFEACLRTLAPMGRLVAFGIASREQNEVKTGALMRASRAVVGFWAMHLLAGDRDYVATAMSDLFAAVAKGEIEVVVGGTYPLSQARHAHDDLRGRRTHGKLLLDPHE
jgi:NADPH2:quinone reductase